MTEESEAVHLDRVRLSYGKKIDALAGLTLTLETDKITGLLGRNGAGKSSLLRVVAGREPRLTSGEVTVMGVPVRKSPAGTVHLCSEKWPSTWDLRLLDLMRHLDRVHKYFERDRALELLDAFGVASRRRPVTLSTGQRSAAYASLALASRAPVTLLDEPQLGMDSSSRALFYRACAEEQALVPRTMVISTHLIDESASLFERVVVLDRGKVAADHDVDGLVSAYVRVEGHRDVVFGLPTLAAPEVLGSIAWGIVPVAALPTGCDVRVSSVGLQELSGVLTAMSGKTT